MAKYNGSYVEIFESDYFYDDQDNARILRVDLEFVVRSENIQGNISYNVESFEVIEVTDMTSGKDLTEELVKNSIFLSEVKKYAIENNEQYLINRTVDDDCI